MFEATQTNTGKQSIHSHPMAIGLIGVQDFIFISIVFFARIDWIKREMKWIILRLSTFIFSYDFIYGGVRLLAI